MKRLLFAAYVLAVMATDALAGGGCGPWCQGRGHGGGQAAFQAAPWYLYWPYNQHFQTPSPMMGAWYGPPSYGGTLQNPYFPQGR